MSNVQTYTVSDQLQRHLSGVELEAGVFTTYTFDPGFFELEIMPVLFDLPFSHKPDVRIAQLDNHVRTSDVALAVFYDVMQLANTEERSAKLDIDRLPVFMKKGVFHPKVFVFGGKQYDQERDEFERVLVVGIGSGNLTRSGWWENVEFFHMEKIIEGERSHLALEVRNFLTDVSRLQSNRDVRAVERLRSFITPERFPAYTQASVSGRLLTRLVYGKKQYAVNLGDVGKSHTSGLELEIISPYIDGSPANTIIDELWKAFRVQSGNVMLPTDPSGNITITKPQHDWLLDQADNGQFNLGTVVASIAKRVGGLNAPDRLVHAKVYRFTRKRKNSAGPRREIIIGGSLNLTRAAWHGINYEAAVILETETNTELEAWLDCGSKLPTDYAIDVMPAAGDEPRPPGFPSIQYNWSTERATIQWLGDETPGTVMIKGINGMIVSDLGLPSNGEPIELPSDTSALIALQLETSSMLTVVTKNGAECLVLVRELDMYQKAPVWKGLSISDILRFWSTLSPDKRAEIVGLSILVNDSKASDELTAPINYKAYETLFDRIGGVHQAFRAFHQRIEEALERNQEHVLKALLFGRGFNGLHGLLDHLIKELHDVTDDNELVRRYLIFRSVEEMIGRLERYGAGTTRHKRMEKFLGRFPAEVKKLKKAVQSAEMVREQLLNLHPDLARDGFLDWFEELHASTIDEIIAAEVP
jgi:hypothetical protein